MCHQLLSLRNLSINYDLVLAKIGFCNLVLKAVEVKI